MVSSEGAELVKRFEFAILNQGMALGTFQDIEGAFDNVSFDATQNTSPRRSTSGLDL